MDIPNLSSNPSPKLSPAPAPKPSPILNPLPKKTPFLSPLWVILTIFMALIVGYFTSRYYPLSLSKDGSIVSEKSEAVSTEDIQDKSAIQVGVLYGDTATVFKDTATGTIEKGSINGVGTHILNREGGVSQRASLTSSVVDLDLFVDRKVEVKGETNASKQTSWLLDVGSVKVLE